VSQKEEKSGPLLSGVLVFPVLDIGPESRIWILTRLTRLIKLNTSQDLVDSIFRVT